MPKTFSNSSERPPSGRAPLNMKASPELRAKIEGAAHESGLSMSQEVERRLLSSFQSDAAFGPEHVQVLLRRAGWAVQQMEKAVGRPWNADADAFFLTLGAIKVALEELQPEYPWGPEHPVRKASIKKLAASESAKESRRRLAEKCGGEGTDVFSRLDRVMSNQELERMLADQPSNVRTVATEHQARLRSWQEAQQAWDEIVDREMATQESLSREGERVMIGIQEARARRRES